MTDINLSYESNTAYTGHFGPETIKLLNSQLIHNLYLLQLREKNNDKIYIVNEPPFAFLFNFSKC